MATNDKPTCVRQSVDFYKEAHEFLKVLLPDDFQQKLEEHYKAKGFSRNEAILFNHSLETAVSCHTTFASLQSYTAED